jgi:hypothetical protein
MINWFKNNCKYIGIIWYVLFLGGRIFTELVNLKFLRQVWLGQKKLLKDTDGVHSIP